MDFEVHVAFGEGQETKTFEQFHDALKYIEGQMAQWNNFHPESTLAVALFKIPSSTDTIGVTVNDEMSLKDIFGG